MAVTQNTFESAVNYCQSFISPDNKPKDRTLTRIRQLMELLGNPQKKLRVIHVTGSYGKSSTAYMIATLLEQKGLTVGLHTKPHLTSVTERMCINRTPIPNDVFVKYVNRIRLAIDAMREQPTYFELLVAIMLVYFYESHVDVAVIEVGRGGRLDATNICDNVMLIITNIYLTHTDILGNTKQKILKEKMGLMRPHTNIVTGVTQKNLQLSIQRLAKQVQSTVQFANANDTTHLSIPFGGTAQQANAALAILAATTYTNLTNTEISNAFSSMTFPARFEVQSIGTNTIIMDAAHSEEKMRFLLHDIQRKFPKQKMTVILRQNNEKLLHTYIKMFTPIANSFLIVSLGGDKQTQTLSVEEVVRTIKKQTHTYYLAVCSIELIGMIRAGLSIPYRLK